MKVKTIVEATEEDYELLREVGHLESPCKKCGVAGTAGCCGCNEERRYRERIAVYKENNLLDAMNAILNINNTLIDIKAKTDIINDNYNTLIKSGLDPNKIFDIESESGIQLIERSIEHGES